MIKEIKNLEKKKHQLLTQIRNLEGKSKDDSIFLRLLKATTSLRREEEHHLNLKDQITDQKHSLNECNTKLKHVQRQFASLQTMVSSDHGHSPGFLINELQKQLSETTTIVRSDLLSRRSELKQQIDEIEASISSSAGLNDQIFVKNETIKRFLHYSNQTAESTGVTTASTSHKLNSSANRNNIILPKYNEFLSINDDIKSTINDIIEISLVFSLLSLTKINTN